MIRPGWMAAQWQCRAHRLAPGYELNFERATLLAGSRPVILLYLDYDRLRGQPSVLGLDVRDVVDKPSHELYRCSMRRRPFGTQHTPRATRQRRDVLRHRGHHSERRPVIDGGRGR